MSTTATLPLGATAPGTTVAAGGVRPARMADDLGPSVLVLVSGWRDGYASAGRRELRRTLIAVTTGGRRPVVWSDRPLAAAERAELEGAGALVFEGDPAAGPVGAPASCTQRPGPAQLVGTLGPDAVIFASEGLLQHAYPFVVPTLGPRPVLAWTPGDALAAPLAARVDGVVRGQGLARALDDALARPTNAAPAPAVAVIDAVDVVPGLVSVVIPVWNRWDLTEACLASLRRGGGRVELVVVDNGSTDATPAGLAAAGDVVVVRNDQNRGFPAAVNQGLRASRGEFVCVLNNDTEVVPGWLDELLGALAVPGTAMVGPRCNAISGSQMVPGAPPMARRDDALAWGAAWSGSRRGRSWPTSRLVGFCLLARRELFSRIGGFDERFGIGNFEDDDLCQRILDDGSTLRVADASVVLHHGSATFLALGLDYAKVLVDASRRRVPRPLRGGPVDALVLAGEDHGATLRSAASLLAVVDRVRVLAPLAAGWADLAVAGLRVFGHDVEVLGVDWAAPDGAGDLFGGLGGAAVLVVAAGEEVVSDDPGRTRAELAERAAAGVAADVVVGARVETRLAPNDDSALEVVGGTCGRTCTTFSLVAR